MQFYFTILCTVILYVLFLPPIKTTVSVVTETTLAYLFPDLGLLRKAADSQYFCRLEKWRQRLLVDIDLSMVDELDQGV